MALDKYLASYNPKRPHQDHRMNGRPWRSAQVPEPACSCGTSRPAATSAGWPRRKRSGSDRNQSVDGRCRRQSGAGRTDRGRAKLQRRLREIVGQRYIQFLGHGSRSALSAPFVRAPSARRNP